MTETVNYTVKDFKYDVLNRGLFVTDMQGIHTAIITFDNGDWMGVSLWDGEDVWRADCAFRANGYPMWSHGTGQGMRGLPEAQCGPLNDILEERLESLNSWADNVTADEQDAYGREAEESMLDRPLFPNEY